MNSTTEVIKVSVPPEISKEQISHDAFTLNSRWSEKINKVTRVEEIFDLVNLNTLNPKEKIEDWLIKTSFFLPKDLLDSGGIRISSIIVLSTREFASFNYKLIGDCSTKIHSESHSALLLCAKYIGVSCRYTRDGILHVVCKVWYGAPPFDITAPNAAFLQKKRIHKLYKFCGLVD